MERFLRTNQVIIIPNEKIAGVKLTEEVVVLFVEHLDGAVHELGTEVQRQPWFLILPYYVFYDVLTETVTCQGDTQ